MEFDLSGRVVVVTGAAGGQGAAHARTLAAAGAALVLTDLDEEGGAAVARAREQDGAEAVFVPHDVSSARDWARVADEARARFGRIDVLVNNAGLWRTAPVGEQTEEGFRALLDVNLLGPFLGIRAVLPALREAGGGSVVNVSSTAGLTGIPGHSAYGATKFGLRGLTRSAALDLAPEGIRVNSVHPGAIDTPMIADVQGAGARVPLGRVGAPRDVTGLVLFLASDASGYVTGAEFVVDGGSTA
ncbi:glucose 1-dehydrogenase [Streptomyces albiaxialis]|uniref:Glucose 1-dehydrogenase n=1 Tax=Streptomyces albiaxialis TaxID=329523 RepID=A0ABN2VV59_9ACTN